MDNKEFMDELSLPQKESMLRLAKALEEVEQDLESGTPCVPAEQVLADMREMIEAKRREQKHG